MEHYLVVDTMCPGSYGMILFVKDKDSGLEHTLKKVECLDESRANQALREVWTHLIANPPAFPFNSQIMGITPSDFVTNYIVLFLSL
ncbi:hypothetical protein SRHO_G00324740 [Serrasalmus rhombeus]